MPHLDSVSQDLVRLAEQAREIVAESVSGLVQETLEGVTKLVYSLLVVDTCQHCSGA